MSYGASVADAVHQACIYAGKTLSGAKAADLPARADQVRDRDQPQDSQGAWCRRTDFDAAVSRRGDRIAALFPASAHGRLWHSASFPCDAEVRTLLEAEQRSGEAVSCL